MSGLIEGDFAPMTDRRREDLRLAFEDASLRRVIATDVWSTGVSFDRLAVLLRADARSSTIKDEQIPGRVSRTHPDKPAGLVIDCDDSFDQGFSRAFQSRKRNYRSKGWREVPSPLRRRQRLTGR
jgi:late competence protein required for DNA uptake (superfamily II DNA/RNA helicase)